MRILQISDTHLGITTEGQLRVMLGKANKEEYDIVVHCGDYSGGRLGWKKVRATLELMRKHLTKGKPVVSTIGNHDYWSDIHSTMDMYNENMEKICDSFREFGVHYLDLDGLYIHPDHSDVILLGSSGWYTNPNPPTNDGNFLPIGMDGDTHRSIRKYTEDCLWATEGKLAELWKTESKFNPTVVFVSHFPVINTGVDYKGSFEEFSWSEGIGEYFQKEYNCRHFLNGHAHQLHKGPLRYECGPDYCRPTYQIVEV